MCNVFSFRGLSVDFESNINTKNSFCQSIMNSKDFSLNEYLAKIIEDEKIMEEDGLAALRTLEKLNYRTDIMTIQLEKLKIITEQYQQSLKYSIPNVHTEASSQYTKPSFERQSTATANVASDLFHLKSYLNGGISTQTAINSSMSSELSNYPHYAASNTALTNYIPISSSFPQSENMSHTSNLPGSFPAGHSLFDVSSTIVELSSARASNHNIEFPKSVSLAPELNTKIHEDIQTENEIEHCSTFFDRNVENAQIQLMSSVSNTSEGSDGKLQLVHSELSASVVETIPSATESFSTLKTMDIPEMVPSTIQIVKDLESKLPFDNTNRLKGFTYLSSVAVSSSVPSSKKDLATKSEESPAAIVLNTEDSKSADKISDTFVEKNDKHLIGKNLDETDIKYKRDSDSLSDDVAVINNTNKNDIKFSEVISKQTLKKSDKDTKVPKHVELTNQNSLKIEKKIEKKAIASPPHIKVSSEKPVATVKETADIASSQIMEELSSENEDDYHENYASLTASSAYQNLLGAVPLPVQQNQNITEDTESEDDVERVLAMQVKKPKTVVKSDDTKSKDTTSVTTHKAPSAKKGAPTASKKSLPSSKSSAFKNKLSKASRKALGFDSDSDEQIPNLAKKTIAVAEDSDEFDFYD